MRLVFLVSDQVEQLFSAGVSEAKNCTVYFPITLFCKCGENVIKCITKGHPVLVEGRIEVSDKCHSKVVADLMRLGPAPAEGSVATKAQ